MSESNHPTKLFLAADGYERLTGGWPARVSANLVANLPVPITSSSTVLDNACGSGAVTTAIINATKDQGVPTIHATDISPGMIEHCTTLYKDYPSITTTQMDSQALKFEDNKFSHIICAFGVFFCPDYNQGFREMYRVAAPDSITVVTSWNLVGWHPIIQQAIKAIKPDQEEPRFPAPEGFKDPQWVKERMEEHGFKDVEARQIDDWTIQPSFELGAAMIMGFMKDAFASWSDEERAKFPGAYEEGFKALGYEQKEDGSTYIPMKANCITGRK